MSSTAEELSTLIESLCEIASKEKSNGMEVEEALTETLKTSPKITCWRGHAP